MPLSRASTTLVPIGPRPTTATRWSRRWFSDDAAMARSLALVQPGTAIDRSLLAPIKPETRQRQQPSMLTAFLILCGERCQQREPRLVDRFGGTDTAHVVIEIPAQHDDVGMIAARGLRHPDRLLQNPRSGNRPVHHMQIAGFLGADQSRVVDDAEQEVFYHA